MSDEPDVVAEIATCTVWARRAVRIWRGPGRKDSNAPSPHSARAASRCPTRVLPEDRRQVRRDRQRFEQHMKNMFSLRRPADTAASKARMVLEMETILAQASMDRVSLRDPTRPTTSSPGSNSRRSPRASTGTVISRRGAPAFETLNVAQPDFLKQIAASCIPAVDRVSGVLFLPPTAPARRSCGSV